MSVNTGSLTIAADNADGNAATEELEAS